MNYMVRDFAEKLVAEVEKREVLYNPRHPEYRDRFRAEQEWQAVAESLGSTADAVKKRWQNLRGSYSKSLAGNFLPKGSAAKKKSVFYLADQMSFLNAHMVHGSMVGSYGFSAISIAGEELTEAALPLEIPTQSDTCTHTDTESVTDQSVQRPLTPTSTEAAPLFPAAMPQLQSAGQQNENERSARKRRADRSVDEDSWRDTAETFLKSRMAEKPNPDHEVLKGLLPHISQLNRTKKRTFFSEISQLLFQKLDEQDEEELARRTVNESS